MLWRALKAWRLVTCRAWRALTNTKRSFCELALNPGLDTNGGRAGGEKTRVARNQAQSCEQAGEEQPTKNRGPDALRPGHSVTSSLCVMPRSLQSVLMNFPPCAVEDRQDDRTVRQESWPYAGYRNVELTSEAEFRPPYPCAKSLEELRLGPRSLPAQHRRHQYL